MSSPVRVCAGLMGLGRATAVSATAAILAVAATPAVGVAVDRGKCSEVLTRAGGKPTRLTFPISTENSAVADFNGDGRDDLASSFVGEFGVFMAASNGRLRAPRITAAASLPSATGDFNEDGRVDIASTDTEPGRLRVFLGDGSGAFAQFEGPSVGTLPLVRGAADLNGDEHLDLIATSQVPMVENGNAFLDDVVRVLLGDGDGRFTEAEGGPYAVRHFEPPPNPSPNLPWTDWRALGSVTATDVDRDADVDLVASVPGLPQLFEILENDGRGRFHRVDDAVSWSSSAGPRAIGVTDIDRDGDPDLAVLDSFPERQVIVLEGDGDGRFTYDGVPRAVLDSDAVLTLADVGGSAHVDLIAARGLAHGASIPEIDVLPGDGTRFRQEPGSPYRFGEQGSLTGPQRVGDFDGDGRSDLVTAIQGDRPSTRLWVHLSHPRVRAARPETRVSDRVIRFGASVRLLGTPRCDAPSGAMRLFRRSLTPRHGGRWHRIAATRRGRQGIAVGEDRPSVNVQYQWRQQGRRGRSVTVRVAPVVTAVWTADRSSSRVAGRVRPAHPGHVVRLTRRADTGWSRVASGRLDSHSRFSISMPPRNAFEEYRVTFPKDPHHARAHSQSVYPPAV